MAEEARVSFHKIKQIINDIPTLFFQIEGVLMRQTME